MTQLLMPADLEQIVVIRAQPGVGDMLCAVPALRSVRAAWPRAVVTLVGVPQAAWFAARFPMYVDEFLPLPMWPMIPETNGAAWDTVHLLAGDVPWFDLAVQLHGSGGPVNALGRALGAQRVVGHDLVGRTDGRSFLREWPTTGHEIERLNGLVQWFGCPDTGTALEFPEQPADLDALDQVRHLGDGFVVVHPGASRPDRRWSAEGFARVIDGLGDLGLQTLLTGTMAERNLLADVADRCAERPRVLLPNVPLGGLAAVVRCATAVVVNDTGVAHVGVAVGTPTIVIGSTSDLDRWGPLDRVRHAVVPGAGRPVGDVVADVIAAFARRCRPGRIRP